MAGARAAVQHLASRQVRTRPRGALAAFRGASRAHSTYLLFPPSYVYAVLTALPPRPFLRAWVQGSVIVAPPTRECWFRCVTEMLLLCNEASARFAKTNTVKRNEADGIQSKPLGLEYMADRLDTDDPIFGYMVRTQREGWLQGFITLTTFTTWHKDFEFNSLVKEAGISDDDKRCASVCSSRCSTGPPPRVRLLAGCRPCWCSFLAFLLCFSLLCFCAHLWDPDLCQNMPALIYSTYRWDYDNKLALELQEQQRDGDPNGEGIVWHRSSPCLAASARLLNSLDPAKYIQYSTVGLTFHVPGTRP
jgi:hypothetical protein